MTVFKSNLHHELKIPNSFGALNGVEFLKKRYPVIYLRLEQLFQLYFNDLLYCNAFQQLQLETRPISILLHGQSGTGKSLLINHFLQRFKIQPLVIHVGQLQLKYPQNLGHGLAMLLYKAHDQVIVIERIDLFATIPELYFCLQQYFRNFQGLALCTTHTDPSLPFTDTFQLASAALPPPEHSLSFKDVLGMEQIKTRLRAGRHTLLYGPPGTGKTMLATSYAAEYRGHFFPVRLSQIISCYVGVTEQKLATLFSEAKEAGPSIIFLDELDALCPSRDIKKSPMGRKVVTQLAIELDAAPESTRVIAATNRPQIIDPCLLRSGRIEVHLYVGPPDFSDRFLFLAHYLSLPSQEIIDRTEGFSTADLKALIRKAKWRAEAENRPQLHSDDLLHALKTMKPSISKAERDELQHWTAWN